VKTRNFSTLIAIVAIASAALPYGAAAQQATPSPPPLLPVEAPLPSAARIPTPEPSPVEPSALPEVAKGYNAPQTRPTAANIVGVMQQPFVGLSLDDAIGMSLLKNPDLAIAASNTRIAVYQVREAKGAYDVNFQVEPSYKRVTTPALNTFFSGGQNTFTPIIQNYQQLAVGVQGQTSTGATYNVNIAQEKVNDNTFVNSYNPYYFTNLNVSLTQPLLKGTYSEAHHQIDLSVVNTAFTSAQTLGTVSTTISTVEDAYWDLVAAWRNVAIQEDALHQSILQQQSNVRQATRGYAAPIDAVESSTQVATYQGNVFSALQNVSELQNQLKSLILADPGDPIWRANLIPTTPVLELPATPELEPLLEAARKNRPEVAQAAATQHEADVNMKYSKNQLKPQVNLQLNYEGNGFAGNPLPPLGGIFGTATPPPYTVGKYGKAYGNIGQFPTYQAGVVITQPIGNNTARGAYAAALEQERIAKLDTLNVDQRIEFEARDALQAYQASLARLYSARQAREAAQAVYASELRKFQRGASTTFLVNQRQITLVQNEGTELQAQADLNKAVVELQRVDGSILTLNNVNLTTLGSGAPK